MAENYYIKRKDNKHRIFGAIGSFSLHAIIVAILLYIVIQAPNPPWESEGMMMSLGEENMGGPADFPVSDPQPNEQYTPISEQTEDPAEELTTEDPESEAIKEKPIEQKPEKPKEPKPVVDNAPKPQLELPKKVNQQALFQKRKNTGGEGGYGDGEVPGNEGRPDGSPDGNPDGTGTGDSGFGSGNSGTDGVKFELNGRRIKQLPQIEDNSKSTGKVVVRIVVDREGNVIKASPGQVGSTTTEPALLQKAKEGALRAKFSVKEDAAEEQFGTMTVYFRYKQ
jgi:outer membrane biosynthesis protein TonB